MTAAVPDPREPKPCPRCGTVCTHDGWGHVHPNGIGIGIGSCDPRFRDQLARTLYERDDAAEFTTWEQLPDWNRRMWLADADALMPTVAAEVEARVQAAANQREAETLIRLADAWDENASRWYYEHRHTHPNGIGWVGGFEEGWCEAARLLRARAAALASPAPAPRAEETALLDAAQGWILRHSSQPDGDRWRDNPDHLAWAAENLLCDLKPWLVEAAK